MQDVRHNTSINIIRKIKIFNDEQKERQKVADYYNKMLKA